MFKVQTMNREEKAFLANIATILVKDLGIDKKFHPKRVPNILSTETCCDEDGLELFINQIHKKIQRKRILKKRLKTKVIFTLNKMLKLPLNFVNEGLQHGPIMSKDTYEKLFSELKQYIPNNIKYENMHVLQRSIFNCGLTLLLQKKENLINILKKYEVDEIFFHKVAPYFYNNIVKDFSTYVKWPETLDKKMKVLKEFCNVEEHKKLNVFGVINSKIIDVNFKEDSNKNKSFVIQITCDANQVISNVEVEYADSYSFPDTKIGRILLNDSANDFIPDNSYFVGSSGLPISEKLITPFRKINDEKEEKFNSILDDYINISAKMFKLIFNRFQILRNLNFENPAHFKNILKSICIVHNLCLKNDDYFDAEIRNEESCFKPYESCDNEGDLDGLDKRKELLNVIF
ncbi:uncharacterized protein LOC129607144 [Condylostylus longicornis]|uniref:uncharacterized protein LOC129607144 n=1 Tax=Condylostylus longicornis TaxID=2530218 RepID=UPI00244E0495|nr:uncharacterized protein LOC129607144 [Condylostylus longicornis]